MIKEIKKKNNNSIEVLISTMNLKKENANKLFKEINCKNGKIINQITSKDEEIYQIDKKVYSCKEKGISKSRNRAIELSEADIIVFSDNDLKYVENYEEIIEEAYAKRPEADIISFFVENNKKDRQNKIVKANHINYINAMQLYGFRLTAKRESLKKYNMKFDEEFGAGSIYTLGEDAIFLYDALNKRMNMYNVNIKIADVNHINSTWYKGIDEKFLYSEGAVFYRITKKLYRILIIQFAIRKYNLYAKNNISFFNGIKIMMKGAKNYKTKKDK